MVQRAVARGVHDLVVYGFELPLGRECFFSLLRGNDDEDGTYYSSFELMVMHDLLPQSPALGRGTANAIITVIYYYPTRILVCCKPPRHVASGGRDDAWSNHVVLWSDPSLVANIREIVSAAYVAYVEDRG